MSVTCNNCGQTWERDPRLEVPCPDCEADVGQRCRRPSEHECEVHVAREQRALDEGKLQMCPAGPSSQKARRKPKRVAPQPAEQLTLTFDTP